MSLGLVDDALRRVAELSQVHFTHRCNITRTEKTKDAGGAAKNSSTTTPYANVPCAVIVLESDDKQFQTGQQVANTGYAVLLAREFNNTLLDLQTNDRITVLARNNEPLKNLHLLAVENYSRVYLRAVCNLENDV